MPNIGVVRQPSSLRRTKVRLAPQTLHALILDIYEAVYGRWCRFFPSSKVLAIEEPRHNGIILPYRLLDGLRSARITIRWKTTTQRSD
jgi:hypothetical protein